MLVEFLRGSPLACWMPLYLWPGRIPTDRRPHSKGRAYSNPPRYGEEKSHIVAELRWKKVTSILLILLCTRFTRNHSKRALPITAAIANRSSSDGRVSREQVRIAVCRDIGTGSHLGGTTKTMPNRFWVRSWKYPVDFRLAGSLSLSSAGIGTEHELPTESKCEMPLARSRKLCVDFPGEQLIGFIFHQYGPNFSSHIFRCEATQLRWQWCTMGCLFSREQ